MKRLMLAVFAVMLGLIVTLGDASARRLGGGRSFGMQRAPISQSARQARPPQAPVATPAPTARPQTPPAQSGWRRWAGPLAGLAAGIGLAALLSHFGVGGNVAGLLLMVIVAVVAFALLRRLFAGPAARRETMAYAGNAPAPVQDTAPAYGSSAAPTSAGSIPAGFDIEAFTRSAKVNFIRLQAAHDAGNLDDIREFTSPEMFAELKLDIDARAGRTDRTDVVSLEAQLLDVTEEPSRHIASVRFTGLLREEANAAPAPFDEIWHLAKPVDGSRGWVLAGIEQLQ